MSNKKSLLTESEIRRFMKLANIPAIGNESVNEMQTYQMDHGAREMEAENYPQEEAMLPSHMEDEGEMPELDDAGGEEMPAGDMGGDKESKFQQAVELLADLVGVDVDFGGEEAEAEPEMGGDEEEMPMGEPEGDEEESGEESDEEESDEEEGDEEEEEESDEEESEEEMQEASINESLVDTVLSRVTARLIAEAKKKKAAKGKKDPKAAMKKKKEEAEKKKKLAEANAPAPKSSMSNSSKAGVAKGHGPGSKAWGTSEKASQEWKEGKNSKGSHEMETVSASSEHTVTHGKKNLATMGGNKKK